MIIARIEGANRVCGKSQGYMGLPVRDELVMQEDGKCYNVMHKAWEPTPEEIEAIKNGAKVIISVIGTSPQPIIVNVGK